MQTQTALSYRIAAIDGGNPTGLLLALYDTLCGNLLRAAGAVRLHNIELRCSELNHAYAVLGQLESWLVEDSDSALKETLTAFYSYLRSRMLEASLKQSASMLEGLLDLVLQVRATWQQREAMSNAAATNVAASAFSQTM